MTTRTYPRHWVRRGEVICGAILTAAQHATRSTATPSQVTCPRCIAVQFAMVGASDLAGDDLIKDVQSRIDQLPRSGWTATRIGQALRRARGR